MRQSIRWTVATALAGVFTLAGFFAALAQQPLPGIDIDAMVAQLGRNDDQAAELTRLDELLASQIQLQERVFWIQESLSGVYARLLPSLTAGQPQGLRGTLSRQGQWNHMSYGMARTQGMGMFGGSSDCWEGTGGMGSMHGMGTGNWMRGGGSMHGYVRDRGR